MLNSIKLLTLSYADKLGRASRNIEGRAILYAEKISQFLALLRYQMKVKAKGYLYWTGLGDFKHAEIMYHHWDAYVQLCDGLGLPFNTIMDEANDN